MMTFDEWADTAIAKHAEVSAKITKSVVEHGPEVWKRKLDYLMIEYAHIGEMVAKGKEYYSCEYARESEELFAELPKLTPSQHSKIVEGRAAQEKRVVDILEQLLKTMSKQMDGIRTMLSFEKEQLRGT